MYDFDKIMKYLFLQLCKYFLLIGYIFFLLLTIISLAITFFPDGHLGFDVSGLVITIIIYVIGHYIFFEPYKKIHGKITPENRVASGVDEIYVPQTKSQKNENLSNLDDKKINKNKHEPIPGKWVSPGEKITISGNVISKGLFYYGEVLSGERGEKYDSALVNPRLATARASYLDIDDTLEYWPTYRDLSPTCRGAFLDWLASNRDMPDTPIGYVFLYFYGLERCIVKDLKEHRLSENQCREICNEVVRLRKIYGEQSSFSAYSQSLLEYVSIRYPNCYALSDEELSNSFESNVLKTRLVYLYKAHANLTADLAYLLLRSFVGNTLRTPARRCQDEFETLFKHYFNDLYPQGMVITSNNARLQLIYHPASPSLQAFDYSQPGFFDPIGSSDLFRKLEGIAQQCTVELDSYSRYLGKTGNSKDDIYALALLPKTLLQLINQEPIKSIITYLNDTVDHKDGVLVVNELWQQFSSPLPEKFNKKERETICQLLNKLGYAVAPDPELHKSKFNLYDKIIIYKSINNSVFHPSSEFVQVIVKLRLSSIIINSDFKIHESELDFMNSIIKSNKNLSDGDRQSLSAYLKWLLLNKPNLQGIKVALQKVPEQSKENLKTMLLDVAYSDGQIDSHEVTEISKLYTLLGFDKSSLLNDIHNYNIYRQKSPTFPSKSKEEVNQETDKQTVDEITTLNTGKSAPSGIPSGGHASADKGVADGDHFIQQPSLTKQEQSENSTFLNKSVLNESESDTQTVQNFLQSIFDNSPENADTVPEVSANLTLEQKAVAIFKQITDKDSVNKADFSTLCSKYNFLIDGAIEAINDWSIEKVDAPVLDQEDDIMIDGEIVAELKAKGEI